MTGKNAQYVKVHSKNETSSDREIIMSGEYSEYIDITLDKT